MEEHVTTIVEEPRSKYIGHVSLPGVTAQCMTQTMMDYLTENKINTSNLVVVGSDGTAVNTYPKR